MQRVGRTEGFCAELEREALGQSEIAEQAEIEAGEPRPAKDIAYRVPETGIGGDVAGQRLVQNLGIAGDLERH